MSSMFGNECSVVHVTTTCEGGAGLAAARLHLALLGIGFPSSVLTRYRSPEQSAIDNLHDAQPGLVRQGLSKVTTFLDSAIDRGDFSLFTPFSLTTLRDLPEILNPTTIVNIHNAFNFVGWKTVAELRRKHIPVVLTLHDERWFTGGCHYSQQCVGYLNSCQRCPRAPRLLQWAPERNVTMALETLEQVDVTLVSPSRWLAERAQSSRVFRGSTVHVIPNPLPGGSTAYVGDATFRREFSAGEVLWVAWLPGKGDDFFQMVVDLFDKISDREVQIGIITTTRSSLSSASLPIHRVPPPTTESERRDFWSSAHVSALTTQGDNFPNVVIESLSVGTPMLVPAVGGALEAVQDTEGGLVLERTPEAFAQALIELYRNPSRVRAIAHVAQENAWKLYNPDTVARRYVETYETASRSS